MPPSILQQASSIVMKAEKILVVLKNDVSGDALAASLALISALKNLGKDIEAEAIGEIPEKFLFLKELAFLKSKFTSDGGTLVVTIAGAKDKLNEFWYDSIDGNVRVFISPKPGFSFNPQDAALSLEGENPDLVVAVGLSSLELAGKVYEKKTSTFFEKPVINIDLSPDNEEFGEVNLIDLTSSSLSEIIFDFLNNLKPGLINRDVATLILSGIIARTDSFQNNKTTPKALLVASKLMELGADQQDVVRNLYKNRSLGLLKLWGRALARLKTYPETGLISSWINNSDFTKSGATQPDIKLVLRELVTTLSDAPLILFLAEAAPGLISGFIFSKHQLNFDKLLISLGAARLNGNFGAFSLAGSDIDKAENTVRQKITEWLRSPV